ncbi:uncharacterized protein K460DRAFT_402869 [Cucurbitaria berberidis CBS 394.84]|uniref:RING-type domain-containing protein n=1 Tax=Cucurbitaria berberidis CBS 394.84 TaxID=1168544 RepID=A0A9P4L9Y6_9PLEO|nr:uncharacterized protein K460DRAFT_402869 [Cucurbitaria berberidis CBS 394.84]KAF1847520.1 hypothetical protein K460DRAFT_402869 [Cucurbitaria berberidis CBS 394.84]
MGTLTADCPRLDSHCPHKLATSCRLTSTPNCCACADERVHSQTYRVYIDGVGFVQRGTRWQGYCWFCKEFWTNRLAATDPPLEISQTRIPEIPDQTEFLERWWEFYQGYRVARLSDGNEQRMSVIGEPLKEVSPGFLPRTLDQLRAGVENDARRPENRVRRRRLSSEDEQPDQPQPSLEDVLDDLLNEAEAEEEIPSMELYLLPQASDTLDREPSESSRPLTRRAAQLQLTRERFARVFGSREDVQQDDYESPLTTMYGRAYDRYRQAEERRAEGTSSAPSLDGLSAQERRDVEEQLLWGVIRESQAMPESLESEFDVWGYPFVQRNTGPLSSTVSASLTETGLSNASTTGPPGSNSMVYSFGGAPRTTTPSTTAGPSGSMTRTYPLLGIENLHLRFQESTRSLLAHHAGNAVTLDNQPDRPPPKTDEEMTKTLACQVCYQQLADTVVLPCGHMVMCQWCADVVVPVRHSHLPVSPTKCPMCRKQVKQRFKVHMGS